MFRPHIRANGDLLDLNGIAMNCKFRCSASGFDLREAHQHKKQEHLSAPVFVVTRTGIEPMFQP